VTHLQEAGHDVTYVEFDGGHRLPDKIVTAALAWLEPAADVH
jgi:predicted esterase